MSSFPAEFVQPGLTLSIRQGSHLTGFVNTIRGKSPFFGSFDSDNMKGSYEIKRRPPDEPGPTAFSLELSQELPQVSVKKIRSFKVDHVANAGIDSQLALG